MRPLLALMFLGMMAMTSVMGAVRARAVVPPVVVAYQGPGTVPGLPGETGMSPSDLLKWGVQQGGLTLVIVLLLWSYRRDFFRKIDNKDAEILKLREERREDRRAMAEIIDRNARATGEHALSVARNTDATNALTAGVKELNQNIHRKREDYS